MTIKEYELAIDEALEQHDFYYNYASYLHKQALEFKDLELFDAADRCFGNSIVELGRANDYERTADWYAELLSAACREDNS